MEDLVTRIRYMNDIVAVLAKQAESLERDIGLIEAMRNDNVSASIARRALARAGTALDDLVCAVECCMAVEALPADATDADYHAACGENRHAESVTIAAAA